MTKVVPCYKAGPFSSSSAGCEVARYGKTSLFSSIFADFAGGLRSPHTRKVGWAIASSALLIAAWLLGCGVSASALEPTTPLASYGRQSWGMENGLPQNTVQALAQTRDGYIWLGTEVGLVRFDGNSFAVFDKTRRLRCRETMCAACSKQRTGRFGSDQRRPGAVEGRGGYGFTTKDGLPENSVKLLSLNLDGSIFIETSEGHASYKDGRLSVFEDVCYHCPSVTDIVHLSNGGEAARTATIVSIGHNYKIEKQLEIGRDLPGNRIQKLFADSKGTLWIGTNGGLARWVDGKIQRFPVTDPLATASVLSIMEDHEGNLWVGTETDGLHILRDQRFRSIGAREGLTSDATTAVVEDSAGTLWVGTSGGGLNALRQSGDGKNQVKSYTVSNGLLSDVILSLAAAPDGDLWVGTPDGLNRIRRRAKSMPSLQPMDCRTTSFVRCWPTPMVRCGLARGAG